MSKLREILDSSNFALGTWSQSASPEILEIIGYSGFDFTIIDTEHGFFGLETAENLVRTSEAAGIPSIVRVAVNEPHLIMKALDIGAQGVLVPQVTTKEEAEKAVSSSRYNPVGNRGACPCIRAGKHMVKEWEVFSSKANDDVVVMVIIEGMEGMLNMEEIIKTPNLDAIMIGPFDMSVSLGVGGDLNHPKVVDFMKKVVETCQEYDVQVFLPDFNLDMNQAKSSIQKWQKLGCNLFTIGTDKLLVSHYFNEINSVIRGG